MIVNILTGYTIKYFDVLYMAITCIYVIAAILIIRSDIIKQQIELSKIMQEQEKVRQEMARREQEKQEEEEKERIREGLSPVRRSSGASSGEVRSEARQSILRLQELP